MIALTFIKCFIVLTFIKFHYAPPGSPEEYVQEDQGKMAYSHVLWNTWKIYRKEV